MDKVHHFDSSAEHRKYTRLKSVFPVDFTIVRLQGDLPGLDWQQGQTKDISEEGICLETTNLTEPVIKFLNQQNIMLELRMFIPPTKPAIKAVTEVVWFKKEEDKFIVGLKFRSIIKSELNRILSHAHLFRISSKIVVAAAIIFLFGLIVLGVVTHKQRIATDEFNRSSIQLPKEANP